MKLHPLNTIASRSEGHQSARDLRVEIEARLGVGCEPVWAAFLLEPRHAAEIIGVNVHDLLDMTQNGLGPPHVLAARNRPLYKFVDLLIWRTAHQAKEAASRQK